MCVHWYPAPCVSGRGGVPSVTGNKTGWRSVGWQENNLNLIVGGWSHKNCLEWTIWHCGDRIICSSGSCSRFPVTFRCQRFAKTHWHTLGMNLENLGRFESLKNSFAYRKYICCVNLGLFMICIWWWKHKKQSQILNCCVHDRMAFSFLPADVLVVMAGESAKPQTASSYHWSQCTDSILGTGERPFPEPGLKF